MSERLPNYFGGRWQVGDGPGTTLFDPVLGDELVRVDSSGLDLAAGFAFAREQGGEALRALSYGERAELLTGIAGLLQSRRDAYFEISTANSGTVQADSATDVDGAIYTLGVYARLGATLGESELLADGASERLGRDQNFRVRHVLTPTPGLALFINAFNFPAWGLWEKAAPALLSGVPVVVKPATATAWLTQRMVADVIESGLLPRGALSVVCGSSAGLLDALQPFDVVSFTGSAETAALIRGHDAVTGRSVRVNVEADSLNAALLLPGQDSAALDLLAREAAREMTAKSGQKCTAIRRILVPQDLYAQTAEAIGARLARTTVGNPRHADTRMGALVSQAQKAAVRDGLLVLQTQTETLFDGAMQPLLDADRARSCCLAPTLLGTRDATGSDAAALVHDTEVFGPVATLLPYRDLHHALALLRRGGGSLVASLYGSDLPALAAVARQAAPWHGRVHVVSPDVGASHSGHGNVMPQALHGGPGRAGGGEELGGLRALNFYHRRSAIQAASGVLDALL
ncbi:MAG: 3,4-dehydroadipyl-CoA semialdehyde dehydrogenase [Thiomonas sp.]